MTGLTDALDRAGANSGYLARQMEVFPDIVALLADGAIDVAWDRAALVGEGEPVGRALRLEKRARGLVIAIADLAGAWPLETVTARLSAFADAALDRAIATAFQERYPDAEPRGFAVLALGKHGSAELNYSSDIDPILLFDPTTLPHSTREEPVEAAVRLGRRVVSLMNDVTADGYVFRVDLRLRPSPEATPIVLPVEAAISYYESTAMGWEQAAFIRARAAAGDRALGQMFLTAIRPFVWRRSLDFGAVSGIGEITRRIRDHYAQGQRLGAGYDLKRGRGGIREVEFFAQIHQLIHGGRDPSLRAPATLDALAALTAAGIVAGETTAVLGAAYREYRTIEHRLQMVNDLQTHSLPTSPESLDTVARLAGLADGDALVAELAPHIERVGTLYDGLVAASGGDKNDHLSRSPDALAEQLAEMGFADPAPALARIAEWREGNARVLRSPPAREALEDMLPEVMRAIAKAPDPAATVLRLDALLRGLPSAINIFRLLSARPGLAQILVEILSHAPTLAEALGRQASLLDGLIDASAFDPMPPIAQLIADFGHQEAGEGYEALLDSVRKKVGERRFALGVQIVRGASDPIEAAAGYGRVAGAAIEVLAAATVAEFERTHGRIPGGELVILALGRLGGGLLTHASDLDLIFLFTGDFAAESDGAKPLGATQYFNRLAQRVGNALSVATAAGPLYEVDTRLRPSGAQGLLCVSYDSFARYQAESAWAWEHLALTRARPVFGSAAARGALQDIVTHTLRAERDTAELARAAVKMRGDIATHKRPKGDLDVKLLPGGLVDIEFLVHVTQFRTGQGFAPDLRDAIATLTDAGHLPATILPAHDLMIRYLVVARLVTPGSEEPAAETRPLVARACGAKDWADLLAQIAAARQSVGAAWGGIAKEFGDADDRG
ncbi:bifunctional [glutamine synthetase] adenylyltransferase/[glutamine synthetase]-adenylyl-L-tyrosine phosphorylase [Sphingobium sufflavum]|uniref:bifunctional [glutamine synthetase] adenylyltransferase/[glutamine synthetase]-adenylyl-L-tyrosine phosphorylase n=1 Tax=Sphingobium sufflavum TaxID=1129547 RepID=UPI001F3CB3C8|nr:bifunctional [glutamine synthetase] adenylyltransferase/[glutamine synthetase]-adenylyl-L-tyrosine phosphorylase [Sphingobium sufflavum]MCE7794972.1 bifunctional [glutamine synthetase] adenylyltransferase/[glutamine synthetase]-adenylyl-L-tyrosine phosphorylase [Sphingobium sufflavum]